MAGGNIQVPEEPPGFGNLGFSPVGLSTSFSHGKLQKPECHEDIVIATTNILNFDLL